MPRYFLDVSYTGAGYAGFQVQQNAVTVQSQVESALSVYFRETFELTGSSRTDAGVHALRNWFHFDEGGQRTVEQMKEAVYHLNAILPADIVVLGIHPVREEAHARFDALSRTYEYLIYNRKDPFIRDHGHFYPYPLHLERLNEAAAELMKHSDFSAFSKKNTQVRHMHCEVRESHWRREDHRWVYHVRGNRFLRGMVRGLVGTMLHVGRGKWTLDEFIRHIEGRNPMNTDFSVPGKGLTLQEVEYPEALFLP